LFPQNNYYYLNLIHDSTLVDIIPPTNFHKVFLDTGKDGFIRFSGEQYYDLVGSAVKNFIHQYEIDVFYMTAPFCRRWELSWSHPISGSGWPERPRS
jgi:hypothetical protein